MIKVGLVGAGFMGKMHAQCYQALGETAEVRVTAVADVDPRKCADIAGRFGAQTFATAEEMLDKGDLNTVDICLPTYMHKDIAMAAMEKGYAVFIEKPVCLNRAEAEELLRKQRRTGSRVMVGHCIRFWPEYVKLRQLIREGTFGAVVTGVFRRCSPRPEWAWENWLHDESKSGSAVMDLHIHDVDFVRSIMGEPDSIQCQLVRRNGANSHIYSLYRYGGAVISLEGGWDFPSGYPFEMSYTVQFERAAAVFRSTAAPSLVVYDNKGRELRPLDTGHQPDIPATAGNISSLGGYYNELRYFVERLSKGADIEESSLQEGCASLELLLRSVEAGMPARA